MRGVTVELPAEAKNKLQNLELARMSAEDAGRAAASRLNTFVDADPELREKLADEQGKQARRHGALTQTVSKLRQWLAELPRGVTLESAPPVTVELKSGEKLSDVIAAVRNEIAALRERLEAVKRAPLPLPDMKQLAEEYVVRLMRQARPSVAVVGDSLRVGFRGDMAAAEDVLALVAWAAPESLCRALEREIEKLPTRADALPADERIRRVAELEAQLIALERKEEILIERAQADGLDVLRRPDANPAAVLCVTVVKAQAQVA